MPNETSQPPTATPPTVRPAPTGGRTSTLPPAAADQVELGQWFWVKDTATWDDRERGRKAGDQYEWLGCVMHIGSNYLELHHPHKQDGGGGCARVHFDEFFTRLRPEPEAASVIAGNIERYRQESQRLLAEVHSLTARLGINAKALGGGAAAAAADSSQALVAVAGQADVTAYQNALVVAKGQTLPALFKAIEHANQELARWMLAETLPLKAQLTPMRETIAEVEGRIFNVGLYAGLAEQAVQCAGGDPAPLEEKLHVMQRRLYMDEECLLNYQAGGMEFKDIEAFDAWLAQPANRDRLLPFPRTLVAMRVRRTEKERDHNGDLLQAFININIASADRFTFLYVRNGEQLWRVACEMEFGAMLFPDRSLYAPGEPLMAKLFGRRVDEIVPRSRYEDLLAEYREREANSAAWRAAHPGESWVHDPYADHHSFRPSDWTPFDPTSVYFDDCMAQVATEIREYNRIALILQGLFDRSLVLHPHLPARLWEPAGFARLVELVYDAATLYQGQKPDFEAYRHRLNQSLAAGAVVVGQEEFWLKKEAEKESRRLDNDWRNRSSWRPTTFRPHGNPGPGLVARIETWQPKARQAGFTWDRERHAWPYDKIRTSLRVPAGELLNISAYTPGDYRQFFADPRTRQEYLKWAPLLLVAEAYHAGKLVA